MDTTAKNVDKWKQNELGKGGHWKGENIGRPKWPRQYISIKVHRNNIKEKRTLPGMFWKQENWKFLRKVIVVQTFRLSLLMSA